MNLQQEIKYYTHKLGLLNKELDFIKKHGSPLRKIAIDLIFEINRIELILETLNPTNNKEVKDTAEVEQHNKDTKNTTEVEQHNKDDEQRKPCISKIIIHWFEWMMEENFFDQEFNSTYEAQEVIKNWYKKQPLDFCVPSEEGFDQLCFSVFFDNGRSCKNIKIFMMEHRKTPIDTPNIFYDRFNYLIESYKNDEYNHNEDQTDEWEEFLEYDWETMPIS